MTNASIFSFILNAGPVVKVVMFILFLASIYSWSIIFQRWSFFKKNNAQIKLFEQRFWSGTDLKQLFDEQAGARNALLGSSAIFQAGFKEFLRVKEIPNMTSAQQIENIQRAMRAAQSREINDLETNLPFLATLGSTAPYVGLFGTVWGIMTSFQSLMGTTQQASIAMVAPGISEALIATAMGLFAAIPAVIAYNRFANVIERINNQYEVFQEEFINILQRQI